MAVAAKALPFSFVVHVIALVLAVLVLVWNIHFRGGLAWEDTNKNLIFNVCIFCSCPWSFTANKNLICDVCMYVCTFCSCTVCIHQWFNLATVKGYVSYADI